MLDTKKAGQIPASSSRPPTRFSTFLHPYRSTSQSPTYGLEYLKVLHLREYRFAYCELDLTCRRWLSKLFAKKKKVDEETEIEERKWILKGVECACHSGEVLAMLVTCHCCVPAH
jgi:hypothetical protein